MVFVYVMYVMYIVCVYMCVACDVYREYSCICDVCLFRICDM